jgi:hypothetical protein
VNAKPADSERRSSLLPACRTNKATAPAAWDFVMRSIVASLLTLLLLASSHARAQVPGPVDPTSLKPRLLNIDGGRCAPAPRHRPASHAVQRFPWHRI